MTSSPAAATLSEYVARVSYKSGWSFRVDEPRPGAVRLTVEADGVPDSDDPTRMISVRRVSEYSDEWITTMSKNDWGLRRLVSDAVRDAEVHELREFLRVDGERVLDPHPRSHGRVTRSGTNLVR